MLTLLATGGLLAAGTAAAEAAAPINATAPTISGTERLGQILTVHDGTWSGSPTYAYQWRRCDKAGDNCTDIAQAINGSYRLADADVSSTLRVVVTATNDDGATSAATVATDVVGTGETSSEAPDTATRYDYDAAGRLKSVIGRDASAAPGDPLQAAIYHWDAVGNLLSVDRRATTTPVIDELDPEQGTIGRKVTISGTGFSKQISQDTVRFNGTEATILDASPTKLVVRVPSGATDGAVSAITPGGTTTSPEPFTVTSSLAPHIDAISPSVTAGTITAGDEVTLSGSHFAEHLTDNVVLVNGHRAELVSVTSGTLKIKAPPGTSGGRVVLTTPEGTDTGPDLFIVPYGWGAASRVDGHDRIATDTAHTISVSDIDKISVAVFDGHLDQEITLDAASASGYAKVSIIAPDTTKIGETMIGAGWTNYLDTIHLPQDGTYTVVYEPLSYSTGGAEASITVHDVGNAYVEAQPTTAGTDVDLSSTVAGTNPGVHMDLEAGQEVSVEGSESTFGYSNLRWIAPDGTELIASDAFWGSGAWWDGVRIPTTGRWTLRMDPQGTNIGHIHLKLYDAAELQAAVDPDADGDVAHATTTVPGQNVRFSFEGHAGEKISFKGTDDSTVGASSVTLLSPSGASLQNTWDLHTFAEPTELPADGTYSILVDSRTSQSGVVGLKVWDVPDDIDEDVTPSATGDTKTITIPAAGQKAHLRIDAAAGEKVAIKAYDSSFNQVGLNWYRPDGGWLGSSQYLGTGGTWFGPTKLDPAGTYELRVEPGSGYTGAITLTFYDATDPAPVAVTPTTTGAAFSLDVAVPGQAATATFTGHVGQRIGMRSLTTSFGHGFGFGALYAPDGNSVGSVGIGNGSYTDRMTLTQDGTYTIAAQGLWEDTGLTQMVIYDVPADQTATVTPTLAGVSTHFDISPFQNAAVHVAGTAGDKISAHVDEESSSLNTYWLNASGNRFGSDAWFSSPGGFLDQVTLPATGDVAAVVDPWAWTGGSTTVKLYDAQDLVDDLGSGGTSHVALATPGRNARVTFDAEAGDVVSFDFTDATIPHWSASLYGPSGSQIGYSWGGSSTNTLPADGQYTFVVDPWSEDTGDVDVTVTPSGGSSARATAHTRTVTQVKAGSPKGSTRTLKQYLRGTRAPHLLRTGTPPARDALPKQAVAPKTLAEMLGKRSMPVPTALAASGGPAPAAKHARSPLSARMRRPSGVPEIWRPKRSDRAPGGWVTGRQPSAWATLPTRQGRLGMTSVAGQALKLSGAPLKGVRVSVVGADPVTTTDKTGRFLLEGVPAGKHTLRVEGSAASKGRRRYGDYELVVTLKANATTALGSTLWMTRLDPAGDRKITSPTTAIRMTNPKIPGFEVRIPAGSRVTDRSGRTLHHLNLSAVPLDRPPFALPAGVTVSAYFTVQPGGAYFSKGAQIVYPNYHHLRPRSRVTFWDYDAKDRGWFEYGKGRVTANGKQIVPDKGVRVWKLSGAMAATNPGEPGTGPNPNSPRVGDPVDPYSGLFVYMKSDLATGGTTPFTLTRTYRQADNYSYEFGAGFTTVLDTRLVFSVSTTTQIKLVLTGGTTVDFDRTNSGTDPNTGTYEATHDADWSGAIIKYVPARSLWLLSNPDGSSMEFLQGGPVTAIVTKTGLRTTITRGYRNIVNSLQQVNLPDGRWIRFDGNEIWDNAGRHVHYTFDSLRRLTQVEDADGHTTHYAYDGASDDLIKVTNGRGVDLVQNEYTGGRITKQTLANGGVYRYKYTCDEPPDDNEGGITNGGHSIGGGSNRRSPLGNAPRYSALQVPADDPKADPAVGVDFTEGCTKLLATDVTNPNDRVDRIQWQSNGSWKRTYDIEGSGTHRSEWQTRDPQGRIVSQGDTGGHQITYAYNAPGERLSEIHQRVSDTQDRVTQVGYDANGNVNSQTDPLGHQTQFSYDTHHRLIQMTNPIGGATQFAYASGSDNPTSVTDPAGAKQSYSYLSGDLTSATDPAGHETRFFTDAAGRVTRQVDPLGRTTRSTFNANNQLTSSTDAKDEETRYAYDETGNLTEVTDARGHALAATFDSLNHMASFTDADGHDEHITYDISGRPTSIVDRRGTVTTMRYNMLGQMTFRGFDRAGDEGEESYASSQTFAWDGAGRLASVNDTESGILDRTYDAADDLLTEAHDGRTVSYTYDVAGRRLSLVPAGETAVTYGYDAGNRLTQVKQGAVQADLEVDAAGRRTGATLPNGVHEEKSYDVAGQLVSQIFTHGGAALGTIAYAYDALGRRTASWGSLDETRLPDPIELGTFDAANHLTARAGVTYDYDADGNMTGDGTSTYAWDSRGQLTDVTTAGSAEAFAYDPLGRRQTTTIGGATSRSIWDGWQEVVLDVGGDAVTQLHGSALDDLLAEVAPAGVASPLADAAQTSIGSVGSSGTLTASTQRGPSGERPTGSSSRRGWQGRTEDASGLSYFRARYYDPSAARFISEDPLRIGGGGTNLYTFANGDTVNGADPSGLSSFVSVPTHPFPWCTAGDGYQGGPYCVTASHPDTCDENLDLTVGIHALEGGSVGAQINGHFPFVHPHAGYGAGLGVSGSVTFACSPSPGHIGTSATGCALVGCDTQGVGFTDDPSGMGTYGGWGWGLGLGVSGDFDFATGGGG